MERGSTELGRRADVSCSAKRSHNLRDSTPRQKPILAGRDDCREKTKKHAAGGDVLSAGWLNSSLHKGADQPVALHGAVRDLTLYRRQAAAFQSRIYVRQVSFADHFHALCG